LFFSCKTKVENNTLINSAKLIEISPQEALDSLKTVDRQTLTISDQNKYNLLYIKAQDKLYIPHTSDSIIKSVIDYYASESDYKSYVEALYYGGRVYSDIGDYTKAIDYFQTALENISSDTDLLPLKSTICSQIGRLLNSIRLNKEAIPYIQDAIKIDSILNDSINILYDNQLLGAIYLSLDDFENAKQATEIAKELALEISPEEIPTQDMYLSAIEYEKGNVDSALSLIRSIPKNISPYYRNMALSYAAAIYLSAGKPDTSYIYACELISTENPENHTTGYQILFSPDVYNYIPKDSLPHYLTKYRNLLEKYIDQNENRAALIQNSFYNYKLHDKDRAKAEASKEFLRRLIIVLIVVPMILLIIILQLKNKSKSHLIQLHEALENIASLQLELNDKNKNSSMQSIKDVDYLRNKLRRELKSIIDANTKVPVPHPDIVKSEAYKKLQVHITNSTPIPTSDNLWAELEQVVNEVSKDFRYHLELLTNGNIKIDELQIALLIKCGVTPTQMTHLFSRVKGTISYRREVLCYKIYDQKLGAKAADDIIRVL
jgi:tetratricopeptide (TPR) repeat protein